MAKKPVPKTRNNGLWTEARYNSFIKSLLRSGTSRWGPKQSCISEARVRRGVYRCELCKQEGPATLPPKKGNKRRIKNIVADHIEPVIPVTGFTNWHDVIERMFCEKDNFQAICHACHTIKCAEEREERKKYK